MLALGHQALSRKEIGRVTKTSQKMPSHRCMELGYNRLVSFLILSTWGGGERRGQEIV